MTSDSQRATGAVADQSGGRDAWLTLCMNLIAGHSVESVETLAEKLGVAAGHGRRETIDALTVEPLLTLARQSWARLQSREWLLNVYATLARDSAEPIELDVWNSAPTRSAFLTRHYFANRAALFPGIAKAWPAVSRWTKEYLCEVCGDDVVEIMAGRNDAQVPEQNTSERLKTRVRFGSFAEEVFSGRANNDRYLVSRNRFFDEPGTKRLLRDLDDVPMVSTASADPNDVRLWFGPAGTVTPLHYDDRNNVIVQIVGEKHVRLYRPCDGEFMAQVRRWYANADPQTFPEGAAFDRPAPVEFTATLRPGDALFIPVGWWHAVQSMSPSITLAFTGFGVPNEYPRR